MIGEIIFSNEFNGYEERILKEDAGVRLIECATFGVVELYRIEFSEKGQFAHDIAKKLDPATTKFNDRVAATKPSAIVTYTPFGKTMLSAKILLSNARNAEHLGYYPNHEAVEAAAKALAGKVTFVTPYRFAKEVSAC